MTKDEAKKLLNRRDTLSIRLQVAREKLAYIDSHEPAETRAQMRAKDRKICRVVNRCAKLRREIEAIEREWSNVM